MVCRYASFTHEHPLSPCSVLTMCCNASRVLLLACTFLSSSLTLLLLLVTAACVQTFSYFVYVWMRERESLEQLLTMATSCCTFEPYTLAKQHYQRVILPCTHTMHILMFAWLLMLAKWPAGQPTCTTQANPIYGISCSWYRQTATVAAPSGDGTSWLIRCTRALSASLVQHTSHPPRINTCMRTWAHAVITKYWWYPALLFALRTSPDSLPPWMCEPRSPHHTYTRGGGCIHPFIGMKLPNCPAACKWCVLGSIEQHYNRDLSELCARC